MYALAQLLALAVRLPSTKQLIASTCRLPAAFAAPYGAAVNVMLAEDRRVAFHLFLKAFRQDTHYVPVAPYDKSDRPYGPMFLGLTQGARGNYPAAIRLLAQAVQHSDSASLNICYFFLAQAQLADGDKTSATASLAQSVFPHIAYTEFPGMTAASSAAAYELQFLLQ